MDCDGVGEVFFMNLNTKKKNCSADCGAALFIILIAVALFAALSYAITQSGRGSGSIDREKVTMDAAGIVQWAGQLEQTILRMRLAYKCADTQISFENPIVSGYTNPSAPTDKSCHVFDLSGGGLSWKNPPSTTGSTDNYFFSGRYCVYQIDNGCAPFTPEDSELIVFLPIKNSDICVEINRKLGLPTDLSTLAGDNTPLYPIVEPPFTGTYSHYNAIPDDGGNLGSFWAQKPRMGCYNKVGSSPTVYFFYSVLITRSSQ